MDIFDTIKGVSKGAVQQKRCPQSLPPEKGRKEGVHRVLDIREHTLRLLRTRTGGGASVRLHNRHIHHINHAHSLRENGFQ